MRKKALVRKAYQHGHLMNPATPYRDSRHTDLRRTFRRIRKAAKALANGNVVQIRSKK